MLEVVTVGRARTRALVAISYLVLIVALALPATTYMTKSESFSLPAFVLLLVFWPLYLTITLVLGGMVMPRLARFVLLPASALLVACAALAGYALVIHPGVYAIPIVAIVALSFVAAMRTAPVEVRLARVGVAAGVALAAVWCGVAAVGTAQIGTVVSVAGGIAWSASCARRVASRRL
jgi:hypothetical protein